MKALKLFTLIFFLCGYYQQVEAGTPAVPAPSKAAGEQKHQANRAANTINFNNPNSRTSNHMVFSNLAPYKPSQPHKSSGHNFFRSDFGHVMNLGHMVYIGISEINLPCATYTDADKFRNHAPNAEMRNRDIALVSAVSALCVAGLILAPIIHSFTGHLRYHKGARGIYTITPNVASGMGVIARF